MPSSGLRATGAYEQQREDVRRSLPIFLSGNRRKALSKAVGALYAEDQAEILSELTPDQREMALRFLGARLLPESLTHFEPSLLLEVVSSLSKTRFASMLTSLQTDDLVELFELLPLAKRRKGMDLLVPRTRLLVKEGLSYAEDSAGRLMRREIASVPEHWSVGQVIDYFRAQRAHLSSSIQAREAFYSIILVSSGFRPIGTVPVSRLLGATRTTLVSAIADEEMHLVEAEMHTDKVANLFHKYGLVELPVVDNQGRLCGSITADDVVEVIEDRNEEDILNLAGVSSHDFYADIGRVLRSRVPWLFLNLVTAFLASSVVSEFSDAIERLVALAVLMPIVASMGGNAGTQTLAVTVRSLALQRITGRNVGRLISKECLLSVVSGLFFATLTGVGALLWFDDAALAIVIVVAMSFNIMLGGFVGVCMPICLQRLGQDPAVGSSILLTTCTDIFGFFSFLGLAAWILL